MSGRVQGVIQTIGAIAAVIAAVVTLSAFVFSTPHDLNNWRQVTFDGYSVTIDKPENNAAVGSAIEVRASPLPCKAPPHEHLHSLAGPVALAHELE